MFDQRTQLRERLRPVVRTLRGVRFWWITAAVLVLATITAAMMIGPVREGKAEAQTVVLAVVGTVAVGGALAWLVAAVSYRNERDLAMRLERRFPTLQQRLLTAIDLAQSTQGKPLGFLQTRVIDEAHSHSKTHRWTEVVPAGQVVVSRLACLAAIAAMVGTLAFLVNDQPVGNANSQGSGVSAVIPGTIQVEPGNTEVERGTSMIVTARFQSEAELQSPIELICVAADGSQRRYTMRQTLEDPIVSAFVPSIDSPLRYQVVSPTLQSEFYQADVFDFPALVRADAELEFPQYTSMPNKRIEDTLRVSVVEGTKVSWDLLLNKPVKEATLVGDDNQRIALVMAGEDNLRFRADFVLDQSRRWRLELVDEAGRQNKFPPELVAKVFANEPPSVKMLLGGDAEASPLEEVPIAVSVKDDFEVVRFGVSYGIAGGQTREIVLGESVLKGETRRGDHLIDLESLETKADQLLTYHLWAEDLDRNGQVRRNQGDLHFIEIRPFEEIYREDQSSSAGASEQQQQQSGENGRQAEELAELQKQIINATWKVIRRETGDARSPAFAGDVDTIAKSQADALDQVQQLAENVSDDQSVALVKEAVESMTKSIEQLTAATSQGDAESLHQAVAAQQAAYQALLGLRAREFQVSRSQRNQQPGSARASQQRRQQQLNELELKNDSTRYETQSQAQAQQAQAEATAQREAIDRLRELAQRQEDINKQVAQLQSALELAQTDAERDEVLRQLKRLRDQEQELLRDADELGQRMQEQQQAQAADSQALQQAAEQLEQTRENLRQATEALQQNDASSALAAGTRAERELDETREQLREQASGNFNDAMREIRSAAKDLDDRQKEIASQIVESPTAAAADGPGLRPEVEDPDLVAQLQEQRKRLEDLMKQVEQTVQQAESTEPLLAQNLYDTYRTAQQQKLDNKLSDTAELLRRGLQQQAEGVQRDAAEAISDVRQRLEKAADSVLGDQTKALERALGELDRLQQQLDGEIETATGRPAPQSQQRGEDQSAMPSERSGNQEQTQSQPAGGQQPGGQQPGGQQPSGQQPGDQQEPAQQPGSQQPGGQQPDGQQPNGQQPDGRQPGGQPSAQQQTGQQDSAGQQAGGQQPGGQEPGQQASQRTGGMLDRFEQPATPGSEQGGISMGGQPGYSAPIAGEGFREWSDRLRDVEQMIEDPELRAEATRIRERARQMRGEMKRHSLPPQWDEIEQLIAKPLRELKTNVAIELLRRSADRHAIVPLDRDPVPDRFGDAVRRYYENLGSGQ